MSRSPAKQLEGFIAKFDPAIGALVRSARSALRKRFPTAHELVYDNYNALAIGFCTTERTSDCIVSLAVYPKNVALSFFYGAKLSDPDGILLGSGNQHRYIRLTSAATLAEPAVAALLQQAAKQAKIPLRASGRRSMIIQSISARQRPRRPVVRKVVDNVIAARGAHSVMTSKDFRRIALGLNGATESAHMGHPDFRVNGRIFATLHADSKGGMVKLTPEQQQRFITEHPQMFAPENGAWGRQGCTRVELTAAVDDVLGEAMTLAWQNTASQSVARRGRKKQATKSRPKRSRTV